MSIKIGDKSKECMRDYTNSTEFKNRVEGIVSDYNSRKDLWKLFFEGNEVKRKTEEIVQTSKNKLNSHFKKETNTWKDNVLPSLAKDAIHKEIPEYFNNNTQVQDELCRHVQMIRSSLDIQAPQIINQIVSEPQYQTFANALVDEMRRRTDDQAHSNQILLTQQLSKFDIDSKQTLNILNRDYQKQISDLTYKLQDLTQTKKDLSETQKSLHNTQTLLSVVTCCVVGLTGFIVFNVFSV